MATQQRICWVRILRMSPVLADAFLASLVLMLWLARLADIRQAVLRGLARLNDIHRAMLRGLARLADTCQAVLREFGEFYANLASLASLANLASVG